MVTVLSAGVSEQGNVRANNEDRYHIDDARGIYLVVDGMGGQAAGEEAAAIAVSTIRGRLERATDSAELRIREAIALANNAIFEAAATNPEWAGMACVLTVAVVEDGVATVGHVGDSRAYRIAGGRIEKITRDHSPVGEREDSGELTEEAAMRHPRRNEVYRDVGSMPRTPDDTDFVEIYKVHFGGRDALLLCSDGLSDVVPSQRLFEIVESNAGNAAAAIGEMTREAVAGGNDNVSAVLVEGPEFAQTLEAPVIESTARPKARFTPVWLAMAALFGFACGYGAAFLSKPEPHGARVLRVGAGGFVTVPEAVLSAEPGDVVEVAPGDYPERVLLKEGTRLNGTDAAHLNGGIMADGLKFASVEGVTAHGITIRDSHVDLDNVSVPGAPVEFAGESTGSLRHSRVGAVVVKDAARPLLEGNTIESGR
ncbi:MAG: protein phosphatase 2C domain-containing protein [Acidobacteriota bacterium]|nr:protein phosphatase 2C domain-containing protein [Acidobacteriota bacterium]